MILDAFGTSCGMCCFSLHSCIFWVRSSAHRWKQVSLTTLFSDASRLCQSSLFQFICNRRLLPYTSTSQVSCICLFGAMFPCGCRKWKYHCITVLLSFYCMQVFWRTCRHNDFSMHLPLALVVNTRALHVSDLIPSGNRLCLCSSVVCWNCNLYHAWFGLYANWLLGVGFGWLQRDGFRWIRSPKRKCSCCCKFKAKEDN